VTTETTAPSEHWHVGDRFIVEHVPEGETFECSNPACTGIHLTHWWVIDTEANQAVAASSREKAFTMAHAPEHNND
jgi:hypothetical protein